MFLLEKMIILCISPLGMNLSILPVGLLLILLRKRTRIGWCMVVAMPLIWLWVWSLPVASIWLRQGLERQTAQRAASEYPTAEAIVVLGGSVEGGRSAWRGRVALARGRGSSLVCRPAVSRRSCPGPHLFWRQQRMVEHGRTRVGRHARLRRRSGSAGFVSDARKPQSQYA